MKFGHQFESNPGISYSGHGALTIEPWTTLIFKHLFVIEVCKMQTTITNSKTNYEAIVVHRHLHGAKFEPFQKYLFQQ